MNDPAATALRATPKYDPLSIALHWLTVLLLVVQFGSAWWMERGEPSATVLLMLHRSCGVSLCVVIGLRLTWRLSGGARVALPESTPGWQKFAAGANEYGLYAFLALQLATGLADVVLRGRPFDIFAITVPALTARHKEAHLLMHAIHGASAWCILALIAMHITAAAYHGVVLRDGVVQKMLPGKPAASRDG